MPVPCSRYDLLLLCRFLPRGISLPVEGVGDKLVLGSKPQKPHADIRSRLPLDYQYSFMPSVEQGLSRRCPPKDQESLQISSSPVRPDPSVSQMVMRQNIQVPGTAAYLPKGIFIDE